jgi:hypothetical protein
MKGMRMAVQPRLETPVGYPVGYPVVYLHNDDADQGRVAWGKDHAVE